MYLNLYLYLYLLKKVMRMQRTTLAYSEGGRLR